VDQRRSILEAEPAVDGQHRPIARIVVRPDFPQFERLRRAERLYIAGEASSHCVKATTEHLVEALSEEEARRLVLISDGMSTVAGFEAAAREFVAAMQARGVSVKTAAEVLEELRDSAV